MTNHSYSTSNEISRTVVSATAIAFIAAASTIALDNSSDSFSKKYVDCSYESIYPTRTLSDVGFIRFENYIPHDIKDFIARIGLSESDVSGIVSIVKKIFNNPPIAYAIDVDEDGADHLSVTVFDASDDFDEKDKHIESFYNIVNFDKRWHNFFSKSIIYFE